VQHLLVSTPASPARSAIRLMRYMWSAMLSGPATPLRIHPVRFVVCAASVVLVAAALVQARSTAPMPCLDSTGLQNYHSPLSSASASGTQ